MCSEVVTPVDDEDEPAALPAETDAADVDTDPDANDSDADAETEAGEELSEAPGITTDTKGTSGTSSTVEQPGQ